MKPEKIAELEVAATAAAKVAQDAGGEDENLNTAATTAKKALDDAKVLSQDPVKKALEDAKNKKQFTDEEKATYTFKKQYDRLVSMGKTQAEIATILGIAPGEVMDDDDDNAPVTMGMLKKMQQEGAVKTALQLAEDITDPSEQELVKFHIENTIRSSGKPETDLANAIALVASAKNAKIVEEIARKGDVKRHSSASGAPGRTEPEFTPTAEEAQAMKLKGPNGLPLLTKDDILKVRKQEANQ